MSLRQVIVGTSLIVFTFVGTGCAKFLADLKSGNDDSDSIAEVNEENPELNNTNPGNQASGPLKAPKRTTKEDFVDQSQEEGSLWASSGQTNYYFTKNKVRSPGDIVTVKIENELFRGIAAEVKKSLNPEEKYAELAEAKENLRNKLMKGVVPSAGKDQLTTTAAAPQKPADNPGDEGGAGTAPSGAEAATKPNGLTPADVDKQVAQLTLDDLDISNSLEIKNGDMMMGEILGRYPNGNYKIRASKKVLYKKSLAREVTLLSIVKAADIGEDTDTVNSGKLYDYQIEVAR